MYACVRTCILFSMFSIHCESVNIEITARQSNCWSGIRKLEQLRIQYLDSHYDKFTPQDQNKLLCCIEIVLYHAYKIWNTKEILTLILGVGKILLLWEF